jgi:cysteine desulfurase
MMGIGNISVSSGSACTSASLEPSYVLRALGVNEELAHTSLRIGIGRFTTEAEIDHAAQKIISAVNHLRSMSPLWEMHKQGIDLTTVQWAAH